VVFRFPEDRTRPFIKRRIGLPGETVEIRRRVALATWGPQMVPAAKYFVLRDSRDNSRDSRSWGLVPEADLLGRAAVVYWSWDAENRSVRWIRIGGRPE